MDEKVEFGVLVLAAVRPNEFVLYSLRLCVRHALQFSLAFGVAVEEVETLAHDLLDEVLPVDALGVLMQHEGAVLQASRSACNRQRLVVLVHLDEPLNWLSGRVHNRFLGRFIVIRLAR